MKTVTSKLAIVSLALSFITTGCATGAFMNTSSRYVKQSKASATLVYTGGNGGAEAMGSKDAEKKMNERCPAGHEVLEEGEYTANNTNVGTFMIQTKIPEKFVSFKCK